MWPLYAAGFTTAFGAHGIAANLGGFSDDAVTSLLVLGPLLGGALGWVGGPANSNRRCGTTASALTGPSPQPRPDQLGGLPRAT